MMPVTSWWYLFVLACVSVPLAWLLLWLGGAPGWSGVVAGLFVGLSARHPI